MPVLPESTKADFLIYTRVVARSYYNAVALGGVSYASANYDSSFTNAHIGVRLAFRGIIRWAGSVAAFKAINQAD